ncbi:MAG TPA: glycosyltransferase [Ktedonobacterales bacterium]
MTISQARGAPTDVTPDASQTGESERADLLRAAPSQPAVELRDDTSPRARRRAYERWLTGEVAQSESAAEQPASVPDSLAGYATRAAEPLVVGARRYHTFAPYQAVYSALKTFTLGQRIALALLGVTLAAALVLNWTLTLIALLALLTAFYLLDLAITASIATRTLQNNTTVFIDDAAARSVRQGFWPSYTVLCPLYHEAEVAGQFVRAMRLLDYPTDRLQVLFLTEEDDAETREALLGMGLPSHFEVVTVPDGKPRTKPRACNYGLMRATGDFIVIFDAEDIPDPLQLKKAALTFAHHGPELACAQASLSFYNPYQNALTRWFTAEYSLWFGLTLPALRRTKSFLPLGGTSNHFRTRVLREVGGWDPFNVTEDCDLGVRLAHYAYTTAIVDSTTYEEANPDLKNWLRQRSRWIKGYMQTYLTHMRRPLRYLREGRLREFFWLQVIVGGRTFTQLVNPLLWLMTLVYIIFPQALSAPYHALFPAPVFYAAAFCLVAGNLLYIYMYVIGCLNRGQYLLTLWALLIPVYWLLMSVAAYIALYQLITRPHYWEKTRHGLSRAVLMEGRTQSALERDLEPARTLARGLGGDVAAANRAVWSALARNRIARWLAAALARGPLKEASLYAQDELTRARRTARLNRARDAQVAPTLALPVAPVVDMLSTVMTTAVTPDVIAGNVPVAAPRPRPRLDALPAVGEARAAKTKRARLALPSWLAWLHDGWLMAALLTAITASAIACIYYFQHQDLLLYTDGESHMTIARRVFESGTPGLAQLGSNWLPLPHILLWPFVWNDFLWRTGLAGTLAAAPCYVVAAVYTFLSAREITGNGAASYVGALALILNPNILYLQTTPLSEATLLAVTAATCFYVVRWARTDAPLSLLAAALCALLGVMTRYEGWSFFMALVLVIAIVDMAKRVSLRRITGDLVVFAAPGFAGITLWLLWNFLLTGNPRYFQNGPYSPSAQQHILRQEGFLPTYHQLWLDLHTYGADLTEYFGPLIVALGAIGLVVFFASSWRKPVGVATLALLAPIALYLFSLYSGQTVIYLPGVTPSNVPNPLFNVRYATSAALPLAIFLAHIAQRLERFRWAPIALAIAILSQTWLTSQGGIISLQDGKTGLSCIVLQQTDIFLLEHYNGGKVLVDSFNDTHNFATLGITTNSVIYEGNNTLWRAALANPARYVQWVIVAPHDLVAQHININGKHFLSHYVLVARDAHGSRVYYSRSAPPLPVRPAPTSALQVHAACRTGLPSQPAPNGQHPGTPSPSNPEGPHASIAQPAVGLAAGWLPTDMAAAWHEEFTR